MDWVTSTLRTVRSSVIPPPAGPPPTVIVLGTSRSSRRSKQGLNSVLVGHVQRRRLLGKRTDMAHLGFDSGRRPHHSGRCPKAVRQARDRWPPSLPDGVLF